MSAPNATQRKACWEARDHFWSCLDINNDLTSACEKAQHEFEALCPSQWVKHFSKRRDFLKYKQMMEKEGFQKAGKDSKL